MPTQDELLLKIIEEGSDNAAKGLDDVAGGLDKVTKKQDDLADSAQKSSKGFMGLTSHMADLKAGLDIVGNVGGKVIDFLKEAVNDTVAYAAEVRDLSRSIGASAEETSSFIQVADDVGVSVGTIEAAFKAAIKNGIRPNIDTLAKLSDEYNAIKDPIERSQFAMDKFGRAGLDMAKILEQGGDAIRAAAKDAKDLGLTLSEEDVKAAREFEIQMDNMGDKLEAFKMELAKGVIPKLNEFFDTLQRGIEVGGYLTQGVGSLDEKENELSRSIAQLTILYGENSLGVKVASEALREYLQLKQQVGMTEKEHATRIAMAEVRSIEAVSDATRQASVVTNAYGQIQASIDDALAKNTIKQQKEYSASLTLLNVSMSGAVSGEMTAYLSKEQELQASAAALKEKIDQLTASNGAAITVKQKDTMTENERAAAQAKLAVITEDLTLKTRNKNETDAEFSSRMANLQVQADGLTGKLEGNAAAVTHYVDNSKKIGELQGEYDAITAKIDENARAHELATKKILYGFAQQQLAADGLSSVELKALSSLAKDFGLVDDKTSAAFEKTLNATDQLAKDQNIEAFRSTMGTVFDEVSGKTETYNSTLEGSRKQLESMGVFVLSDTVPTFNTLTENAIKPTTQAANDQKVTVDLLSGAWGKIPASVKTVYTIQVNGEPPAGGSSTPNVPHVPGTGYAAGGAFTVPPGYPNDSYPMRVSSGERVIVQPQNSVTNTWNVNADQAGMALLLERQRMMNSMAFEVRM